MANSGSALVDVPVALVTGASRGIGRAIAVRLAQDGFGVVVGYHTGAAAAEETAAAVSAKGAAAMMVAGDVADPATAERYVAATLERFGRLDVLVNNAGGTPVADTATASIRLHRKVVELNLIAPLLLAQHARDALVESGGSIVNISSVSGRRPSPGTAAYGAAKAGLDNLTGTLAQELAPDVRVNGVVVGLVSSEDQADHYGESDLSSIVPLGRLAEPSDVGNACLFLASPLAAYITGSDLTVHGGGETSTYLNTIRS